jgi:outer membrane protein assembly factor BamB
MLWLLLVGGIVLLPFGCAIPAGPPPTLLLGDTKIYEDTVWQGRVVVDGRVEVLKGATLTIRPGTEVAFVRRDEDGDGLGDNTLVIKGALYAEGTRLSPILFHSAATDPRPGDWKEIRADFVRDVVLRYCEIRDSVSGLHAHYTNGLIEDCRLRGNIDGARFGMATFSIRNSLIEQNEARGVLTRQSKLQIEKNIFRYNGTGLFFMERDRSSRIEQNNFYANQHHLRIGDFSPAEVRTAGNWLGSSDPGQWRQRIYDRRQDPRIGTIQCAPAKSWRPDSGPHDALDFQESWRQSTGGFVDASPLVVGERLYAASWDGNIYALGPQGQLLWKRFVGAEIDAAPVTDGDSLFVQTWQRQAVALKLEDGQIRWRFTYPASPADDHRQGALLPVDGDVLLPAWGGSLYALNADSGKPRWQLPAHLPLRAAPVHGSGRLYLSGGDGTFTALTQAGEQLWTVDLGAPVLTSAAMTPDGPVVLTRNGQLNAFDSQGRLRWQRQLGELCYYSAPHYQHGYIYLATAAGSLWKLDAASGRLIWSLTDLGAFYGSPLIAGDRLFVGNNSGQLYAINIDSGEILATFQAGRDIQSTPVLFSERLVFGSRDGNLYALDLVENNETGGRN